MLCALVSKLVMHSYSACCNTIYIWQLTFEPLFLIRIGPNKILLWMFSNAQTNLWHLNIFSLATITAPCKWSSRQKWLRGLVQSINFWDTSFGIGPCRTAIIQKIPLLSWLLVFCRHFFLWHFEHQVLCDKAQCSSFGQASGIHLCKDWA